MFGVQIRDPPPLPSCPTFTSTVPRMQTPCVGRNGSVGHSRRPDIGGTSIAETEFFGSLEQQEIGKRAEALWRLVRTDNRFGAHSRSAVVRGDAEDALDLHLSLTKLLGVSACDHLPVERAEEHIRACTAQGFKTDRFEVWESTEQSINLAARLYMLVLYQTMFPPCMSAARRLPRSCTRLPG